MPFVEKWVSRWGLGFRVELRFRACRCRLSAWLWLWGFPIGSIVVPLWGSYSGSYKVISGRCGFGAYGLGLELTAWGTELYGCLKRLQVSIPKREPPDCPDSKTARLLADLRAWDSEIQEART